MVWFLVDDNLAFHKKVTDAGNAAMGVWVRAGAWSTASLTDGFIPTRIARSIGTEAQLKRLVNAGLFESVSGGYLFHDWTHKQTSKQDIEERRERERQRKADLRKRRNVPLGHPPDVPPDIREDSARATPPHPVVVTLGGEGPVGSREPPESPPPRGDGPPNKFCKNHMPFGTDENCHGCRRHRMQYDDWLANQTLERKRFEQQKARNELAAWLDEIPDCHLCDDEGMRLPDTRFKCDHTDRHEVHRNGSAAVREALAAAKAKRANQ